MYKKILFTSLMMIAVSAFGQQNQDNNGWGDSDNNYSNSDNNYNNDNDYPDDYYYEYPTDYYPQTYYQSYYNDYQNSIVSINWNRFFVDYHLNRHQIQLVINLNNRYRDFASWNYYYGRNPDRWYYERFNALRFILGPTIFVNFQNHYYHGYSPVIYFQNYRRTYYVPRFQVNTQYRNVNIVRYRVDRDHYRDSSSNNGLYDPNHRNNNGFQNKPNENNGFRSGVRSGSTPSVRNEQPTENTRDGGFRNGVRSGVMPSVRNNHPTENTRDGGFRSVSINQIGGQRTGTSLQQSNERSVQNSSRQEQRATRSTEKSQRSESYENGGRR